MLILDMPVFTDAPADLPRHGWFHLWREGVSSNIGTKAQRGEGGKTREGFGEQSSGKLGPHFHSVGRSGVEMARMCSQAHCQMVFCQLDRLL